jgi:hypothetical protein
MLINHAISEGSLVSLISVIIQDMIVCMQLFMRDRGQPFFITLINHQAALGYESTYRIGRVPGGLGHLSVGYND